MLESTHWLPVRQVVATLGLLAPGGSFVWKLFTLFEHPAMGCLALLAAVFAELHVFKPATSKPFNSEVYVIAKVRAASAPHACQHAVSHAQLPPKLLDSQ